MSSIHHQLYSNEADKPWLLLIHGLFGNLDNLSALRKHFTEHYNVLTLDLPDHGKSSHTDSFSFEAYSNSIAELMQQLAIKKASIIGHSLGGKVAMQIALSYPEQVHKLVVLDIAPVSYSPRHNNVFAGLNNIDLVNLTSRKEANDSLKEIVEDDSTRQFLLKSLYQENDQWSWRFNLMLLERDYIEISSSIESTSSYDRPVMFIKGELSDYILPEHRSTVLKLFPNSQSRVIGGTGHWLHAEKPSLCSKIILKFLSD